MSSFLNDDVSESNKQEVQITRTHENSLEAGTVENGTIRSNDNNVNNKLEINNEYTKTISEDKCEGRETNLRNLHRVATVGLTETAGTPSNYDHNESNVAVVDSKDKKEDRNVAVAIDNNQDINKAENNKLLTAQSPVGAELISTTCFVSNMTPSDVSKQQTQQLQQQQASSFGNQQTAESCTINNSKNETLTISLFTSERDYSSGENNCEISKCNVNSSSITSPITTTTAETSRLTFLPPSLASSTVSHLLHISSEPTFGVQLRNNNLEDHQEHNRNTKKSYTKATGSGSSVRDWRVDTSVLNFSSVIKSGTVSASASPNMVRKSSDSSVSLPRRVSFPKSDNELVTGYLEPANPWEHDNLYYLELSVFCTRLSSVFLKIKSI